MHAVAILAEVGSYCHFDVFRTVFKVLGTIFKVLRTILKMFRTSCQGIQDHF